MIAQVIQAFPDVFPDRLPLHVPKQRETDHRIDLVSDAKPPAHRIYSMSPLQDDAIKKQLDAYIAAGHIVKTKLPFGAGVLFAKKKDGGLRLCIDYRQLNKLTDQDACPRFRIEQILDQRAQGQYFTKLDWQQGYHQIRMHPDHAKRTAFQTIFGLYHYTVMPFGLANAPATFQCMIDALLQTHHDFCRAYLDDIVIWSSSLEDHAHHVTTILQKLRDKTFYAKLSKCTFAQTEIDYCGFIVGSGGIRTQPEKI